MDEAPPRPRLPTGIWALGFVSLCMDASSELIHALLPVLLSSGLGASMLAIGILEGVAEAIAAITKVFSGTISDALGRRKGLAVAGYALAAVSKPVFPLAGSIGWVATARCLDRVGKGLRGAPRDALVADLTPPELRGRAYGLRQALDSVGAVLGPGMAWLLVAGLGWAIRPALWVAVAPAALSVTLLVLLVREPPPSVRPKPAARRFSRGELARLGRPFWSVVSVAALFSLARFSEAFLVLRGPDIGLAARDTPIVLVAMNLLYAAASYPAGVAADRLGRRGCFAIGLGLLIGADLVLAFATSPALLLSGAALWGLHLGATQGLLSKLVADAAPPELRGTAFGVFNLVCGVAVLLASAIAGAIWSVAGGRAVFLAGAALAVLAAIALLLQPADRSAPA